MADELNIKDILVGEVEEVDKDLKEEVVVSNDVTTIPVEPGDEIVIQLQAQESQLIRGIKDIKEGKKIPVKEDIVDVIDNTLALEVPAVDGAVVTIEIPEDADADELDSIDLSVDDKMMADILTLVSVDQGE